MASRRRGGVSTSAFALVALMLAAALALAEAAKIQTFHPDTCDGAPSETFVVVGNTCQTFVDQGAVLISEVDSATLVSVHSEDDCEQYSRVAEIYGPGCVVQGNTKLRAVWIQG